MKTMAAQHSQISWSHPASLVQVDVVCSQALDFLDAHSVPCEDRFAVDLLLHEALTNAVVHGCAMDPKLSVDGWLQLTRSEVVIEVNDPGRGFPWEDAQSDIPEEPVESGRGMAIYRLYATSYQFNSKGNRVTLRRTLKKERINA